MAVVETRRAADGKVTHRAKPRLQGHTPETVSFVRLTDAKRWAQSTESAIREGRYLPSSLAKRHTLGNPINRYIKEVIPTKPKKGATTEQHLMGWKAELGSFSRAAETPSEPGASTSPTPRSKTST